MTVKRRTFLQLIGLGAVAGFGGWLWTRYRGSRALTPDEQLTLQAFLDTLIPADDTPGAIDLNVHARILAQVTRNTRYRRLVHAGCRTLDNLALSKNGRPFRELGLAKRNAVVHALVKLEGAERYGFFDSTQRRAFSSYYSDSRSWPGVCYPGPPQPRGFTDYTQPPATSC
jgi:hypothetical protein